ncbi:MAG: AAA family ATPase [Eubacterium sp.]|nr:AAA family ATPase [Eubacterium sp.]
MRTELVNLESFRGEASGLTLSEVKGPEFIKSVLTGCLPNQGMDDLLHVPAANHFCLYGPAGTGRHTLAQALAGSLCQHDYDYYHIYGYELPDEAEDAGTLEEVFAKAAKNPCLILAEDLDRDWQWNRIIRLIRKIPADSPVNVVIIEEEDFLPRKSWIRDMTFLRLTLPNRKARERFFEDPENAMPRKDGEPAFNWLAAKTEGLNYAQLKTVVRLMVLRLKAEAVDRFDGDDNKAFEAYQEGDFHYTTDQFEEVVEYVRDVRTAQPSRDAPGPGSQAMPLNLVLGGNGFFPGVGMPAAMPADSPGESDTEEMDERMKAEQELLADLEW